MSFRRVAATSAAVVMLAAAGPSVGTGQERVPHDTLTLRYPWAGARVLIWTPTVVAILSDSTEAGVARVLGTARAVAESAGFDFQTGRGDRLVIMDQAHAALYYVPRDVKRGYVIVAPGRRPDVVRGYVETDTLKLRIRRYLALIRPLEP